MPTASRRRWPATVVTTATLLLLSRFTLPATAQTETPARLPATSESKVQETLADLRRVLDSQRALLEEQARTIAEQGKALAALRQQIEATSAVALAARNDVADLKKEPPVPTVLDSVEKRLAAIEQTVQKVPEMPQEVVSAGEFPGSLRVPGTDVAFKIGGKVRMSLVQTLGPLGVDDRFVTSSIPVDDQTPGQDKRTTYSARPSRVNLDTRLPTGLGALRTFVEGDFAGSGSTARLRHAFIQSKQFVVGQTWSTFSDPEAEPTGIDFEGLNAISLFRQAQIRYTHPLKQQLDLAIALENPAPDLTGASGVNLTPDFIARLRWEPTSPRGKLLGASHVQTALLFRQLRGELLDRPQVTLSTGGFGVNVSGVLVPPWDHDDRVKFASNNGWGIGRYITDLGTLGGQDAVYDAVDGSLRALPVSSGYIGYERQWGPKFVTAITYGIVNVSNLDIQPVDALRRTQRGTLNLTWSPIPQAEIVVEFLGGRRVNKNGARGTSSQIQAGWSFRF